MIKRLIYFTFLVSLWLGGLSVKTVLISSLFTLFFTYIILPLTYHYTPAVQRHLVFLPFVNYPRGVNFYEPEKEGLLGTRNFYLETEKGIKVGIWHILPHSLIDKSPTKDASNYCDWFEKSLSDDRPVFLYLHGNTSSRAVAHRVELYSVLRSLDWHIIAFDYRGYADSTQSTLSEVGVVHDARVVYDYVQRLIGTSPLIVWGHSLGTGVSCHAVGSLCIEERSPSALILESPFSNIKDEVKYHPLSSIFVKMPWFDWFFLHPLPKTGIEFKSDEHIRKINVPILILHAKDDLVVPFHLGQKLYESAARHRSGGFPPVKFVEFEGGHGYGHKFICRAPDLPQILRSKKVKSSNKKCLQFQVDLMIERGKNSMGQTTKERFNYIFNPPKTDWNLGKRKHSKKGRERN